MLALVVVLAWLLRFIVLGMLLTILIGADVLYVLTRAGITVEGAPVQALLQTRRHAGVFGVALLGLLMLPTLLAVGLWRS